MNNDMYEKHLDVLEPNEYEIIIRRYGLKGFEERTQKEVSNELGISWTFVSRVEKRAILKLKNKIFKE